MTRLVASCDGVARTTLERMVAIRDLTNKNFFSATTLARFAPYPEDTSGFHWLLKTLHGLIFRGTNLPFAGRYRQEGETVFVGPERSEHEGIQPPQIEAELARLHRYSFQGIASLDRQSFVQYAALFLHRFFLIHPFRDGNGRVARLMLAVAANATRTVSLGPLPQTAKSRRRYVKSLRYADQRASLEGSVRAGCRPYSHLETWLQSWVVDRDSDDDDPRIE